MHGEDPDDTRRVRGAPEGLDAFRDQARTWRPGQRARDRRAARLRRGREDRPCRRARLRPRSARMTLAELAVTVGVLAVLGLLASRFGLSAIPAYLLAGLLLGPNEPEVLSFIEPSDVTDFVAQLGIVFLLFFLGLEFTLDRFRRSGHHFGLGGSIDLVVNAALGLAVGVAAFGLSFAAVVLAAAVYVSS